MNKSFFALLALFAGLALVIYMPLSSPEKTDEQIYREWKVKFGKMNNIDSVENQYRFFVFKQTLEKTRQHNSLLGRTYDEGLNQFSALTPLEFAAAYLSPIEKPETQMEVITEVLTEVTGPIVDWVSYGAVSPVKNQGSCTATYAFSAVGAIEGISVIFYKNPQEFSVQQIVDCTAAYGNSGCTSGRMDYTFNYVISKGINSWASYPYIGRQSSCQVSSGYFKIQSYRNVTDCVSLANYLQGQPVSIAVDGANFQYYTGGLFSNCGTNLSLAALLVGMTDNYWQVKNSWGTQWGEGGYIRLLRGNTCGICMVGSYPVPL